MWIKSKSEDAFISIEVLISLSFLVVLLFFSWQMLERQKRIIVRANQNVEATGVLFEIRQALRGNLCTENFSGLDPVTSKGVIENIKMEVNGESDWFTLFPAGEEVKGSQTHLVLSGYALDPIGMNKRRREGLTFLKVFLEGHNGGEQLEEEIKLFVKLRNGKIAECSLNPFSDANYFWKDNGTGLSSQADYFQINSDKSVGTINLSGGLIVHPTVLGCNFSQRGTLFWSEKEKRWMICSAEGLVPFNDPRVFSPLGLKNIEKTEGR